MKWHPKLQAYVSKSGWVYVDSTDHYPKYKVSNTVVEQLYGKQQTV